jgi:hypothetical protein
MTVNGTQRWADLLVGRGLRFRARIDPLHLRPALIETRVGPAWVRLHTDGRMHSVITYIVRRPRHVGCHRRHWWTQPRHRAELLLIGKRRGVSHAKQTALR